MTSIVSVKNVNKTYGTSFVALSDINLEIKKGEILALLGPNGAGKTTLISIICGIINKSSGTVTVDGNDIEKDYRKTRFCIGLVPQELTTDAFESVLSTVNFSRGLFGRPPNPEHVESVLRELSLWEKKDSMVMMLSGGMKRRLLIAKALAHEPTILFLDEPTAGVDVELRQDMWRMIDRLRESGVTIVLTTHYIEEAEMMADRIGVINKGRIIVLKEKKELMQELGKKQLSLTLSSPITSIPQTLAAYETHLSDDGVTLTHTYRAQETHSDVDEFMSAVKSAGLHYCDIETEKSSLEDIFVQLLKEQAK